MFPPNSLKTLMDLKLTKDIQDNPSFYEEKSEARILLKKVCETIKNLKIWKENENLELARGLEYNSSLFSKLNKENKINIEDFMDKEEDFDSIYKLAAKIIDYPTTNSIINWDVSEMVEKTNARLNEIMNKKESDLGNDALNQFQNEISEKLNFDKFLKKLNELKENNIDNKMDVNLEKEKQEMEYLRKIKEENQGKIKDELNEIEEEFKELESLLNSKE